MKVYCDTNDKVSQSLQTKWELCKIDIREAPIHFSNIETYLVSQYKLNQKSQFHEAEITRMESEIE
mgnify:CR=1 FL=1